MINDTDEKIIDLYSSGKSIKKVSNETGVSATQVRRILQKNNISARSLRTQKNIECEIIEKYISGQSSEVIAKDYSINSTTVCRILKRNNIEIRTSEENKRKYPIKFDYFSNIDSFNKAWVLGFIYADGGINKKNNAIKITVHPKDIDVLDKIRSELYIDDKSWPEIKTTINEEGKEYVYINISSVRYVKDLEKLGCEDNKTFKIKFPKLNQDLVSHFLRGYYDGDGCISYDDKKRVRVILTGAINMISGVKFYFDSIGISSSMYKSKNKKNVFDLSISASNDVKKVLNLLYNDAEKSLYLDRKFKTFNKVKSVVQDNLKPSLLYGTTNIISYKGTKLTKQNILKMTEPQKKEAAEFVFEYLKEKGFPYPSFKEVELKKDFELLKKSKCSLDGNKICNISDSGLKIFKHFNHHYFNVRNRKNLSFVEAFNDDEILKYVIYNRMGISFKETFNITGNMIRQGLRNSRKAFASSIFKPSVAKFIYDTYSSPKCITLDISYGFGQRMLGAASSNNIIKYVGLDPWDDTVKASKNIIDFINDNNKSFEVINCGSEKFRRESFNNYFDFIFSSPPFYNKEIYSNNKTQAYYEKSFNKFIDDWWLPTCENIKYMSKTGSYFVLNMSKDYADIMIQKSGFKLDKVLEISYLRGHLASDTTDNYYILII